jgi:hypothetical protein
MEFSYCSFCNEILFLKNLRYLHITVNSILNLRQEVLNQQIAIAHLVFSLREKCNDPFPWLSTSGKLSVYSDKVRVLDRDLTVVKA